MQVLRMLSAEGVITMERATLDGSKIKANASGDTFRRREKLEARLALAQEQVQKMNAQAAEEDKRANRQIAVQRLAARQRKVGWSLLCVRLSVCSERRSMTEISL